MRTHEEEYNDTQCELAAWELLKATKAQVEELKTQLGDAKATADLWIQKAKQADEAANDLVAELIDTRREWKAELEEQARLLGMSAERECDLRGKLDRERALADRLAEALTNPATYVALEALAAWKEAREMTNEQINIAIAKACGWDSDDIARGYTPIGLPVWNGIGQSGEVMPIDKLPPTIPQPKPAGLGRNADLTPHAIQPKCDNCGDPAIYRALHWEAGTVRICTDCEYLGPIDEALAAWKEARSE